MPEVFGPVETVHKVTYQQNVMLAVQDGGDRIASTFSFIAGLKGKSMQVVELVGSSSAREDAPENAPTPNIAPQHNGIYVKPRRLDWGRTIPASTEIMAAVDYQSVYVQEGAKAMKRGKDNILVPAIYGPRLVASDDTGIPAPVAFDTANQQIAVNYGGGANTGLTVTKFVAALSKFIAAEIDIEHEEIAMLLTAKQNEDFYKVLQMTSKDYRDRAVFEDKRVHEFMRVKLVDFQRLPFSSTNIRRCPMYLKSGMHWGDAMPLETTIDRNASLQYQPHPYMQQWLGATRSEDSKVVDILCSEV